MSDQPKEEKRRTMTDQAIVRQEDNTSIYMPVMTIADAIDRRNALVNFTRSIMVKDHDFGTIPGTDKPTLYKAGAEKLASFFGLAPKFIVIDKILDFEKGLFYYHYKCELYRNGQLMGDSEGSANSMEKKHRYRNVAEKKATAEDKATAIRKETKTGQYGNYVVYVVPNSESYDLVNTLQKMAEKRALVAAVLVTTNASEFYTQDVEDMNIIEGEWHEPEGDKRQPGASTQPPPTNGATSKQSAKPGRPASPEDVKAGIVKHAKDFSKQGEVNLSEAQINLLRYGLDLCFEGQDPIVVDDKRHALLKYLTGIPSTKDVLSSQFKAIVEKWLEMKKNPDGSGEYMINQFSKQEAESIVAAALLSEGQQSLGV
jgi:hypothetical protein